MRNDDGSRCSKAKFLTVPQVAQELGISERSVWRLIEDEELPAHDFGSSTRVKRSDLDAYIARSKRPAKSDDDETQPEP
jgi:excisionase family DNA binding protein